MAVLSCEQIERIIKEAEEQLNNERVLYEGRIVEAVDEWQRTEGEILEEFSAIIYTQKWLLFNVPQIQNDKAAMQRHHEEIMIDKFRYYNKSKNFDSLFVWIGSLLKNIGFTDYQAEKYISLAVKVGEKLFNRIKEKVNNQNTKISQD
jgi:hypothetical protein